MSALKIAAGDDLVIEIPADASVLLTANEFRALSIAAERDDVEVSIYTDDPLRRQLATLFGVPLVNEIPQPLPYVAPELETWWKTEAFEPGDAVDRGDDEDESVATEKSRRSLGGAGRSVARLLGALLAIAAVAAIAIGLYWFFFSSMTVDLHLKRENVASTLAYQVTAAGRFDPSAVTEGGIVIPGQPVAIHLVTQR